MVEGTSAFVRPAGDTEKESGKDALYVRCGSVGLLQAWRLDGDGGIHVDGRTDGAEWFRSSDVDGFTFFFFFVSSYSHLA